jgi:molybdate transport system ATP-binding protein
MPALRADVGVDVDSFRLDVALDAEAGQVVALLGPNGAGKTTLLRALAGLTGLQRGRVELGGQVLEDAATGVRLAPEARPVGFVFQDHRLFPHLNALDNVAFGLRCRGATRADARRVAADWLDRVGLTDQSGQRPATLSGGQAQRVALARALAIEPALLLLDEPLAALDATTRSEVRRDLRRHLRDYDGVPLLVTHDPIDALLLADRLVIMEGGRVVQDGSPAEITGRPRSAYVADLVGTNLYRGSGRDGAVTLATGAVVAIADALAGDVFLVIDPRAVALHRQRPAGSPRNVWAGTVQGLDVLGDRVRVRIAGEMSIVAEVTPAAVASLDLVDGTDVWAAVKATEVATYPT